jgi:hypothetical protein
MVDFPTTTRFRATSVSPRQRATPYAAVAIAGLGGVGGSHLRALPARDRRQHPQTSIRSKSATSVAGWGRRGGDGRPKTTVLASMARDINPDLRV